VLPALLVCRRLAVYKCDIYACMHIYIYIYIYTYMYTRAHTHTDTHKHMYIDRNSFGAAGDRSSIGSTSMHGSQGFAAGTDTSDRLRVQIWCGSLKVKLPVPAVLVVASAVLTHTETLRYMCVDITYIGHTHTHTHTNTHTHTHTTHTQGDILPVGG
jgi:hypothetical protein